jgi:hypothetical protein
MLTLLAACDNTLEVIYFDIIKKRKAGEKKRKAGGKKTEGGVKKRKAG